MRAPLTSTKNCLSSQKDIHCHTYYFWNLCTLRLHYTHRSSSGCRTTASSSVSSLSILVLLRSFLSFHCS